MIALRNDHLERVTDIARTAKDLMTPNPVSISDETTVRQAAAFLSRRRISAAPVIDEAGRPVGVVSSTDILRHHAEKADRLLPMLRPDDRGASSFVSGEELKTICRAMTDGQTPVRDIMTSVVYFVRPDTPAKNAVETMLELNVRRLFVVDEAGTLVGVISALDVLRRVVDSGLFEPEAFAAVED